MRRRLPLDEPESVGGLVVRGAWRKGKEVKLEGPAVVWVFDVSDFTKAIVDEVPSPADPHDRQNAWAGGIVFLLSCQLKPA